jgi:hypothetical protein
MWTDRGDFRVCDDQIETHLQGRRNSLPRLRRLPSRNALADRLCQPCLGPGSHADRHSGTRQAKPFEGLYMKHDVASTTGMTAI